MLFCFEAPGIFCGIHKLTTLVDNNCLFIFEETGPLNLCIPINRGAKVTACLHLWSGYSAISSLSVCVIVIQTRTFLYTIGTLWLSTFTSHHIRRIPVEHIPSGTSLSLICCRQGTVLSSLTSVLVWNSSSRSAGCLEGNLGLDSGETQHDTVFPIPKQSLSFANFFSQPSSANIWSQLNLASPCLADITSLESLLAHYL